jgi:hypothetical protein
MKGFPLLKETPYGNWIMFDENKIGCICQLWLCMHCMESASYKQNLQNKLNPNTQRQLDFDRCPQLKGYSVQLP